MSDSDTRPDGRKRWTGAVEIQPEQLLDSDPATSKSEHQPIPAQLLDPDAAVAVDPVPAGAPDYAQQAAVDKQTRRSWSGRLFGAGICLLLSSAVASECYRLVSWGYEIHQSLGVLFSLLIAVVAGSGTLWLLRGLKGLRQLNRVKTIREQAEELQDSHTQGHAAPLLQRLQARCRDSVLEQPLQQAISEVDSVYKDGEIIRFVSNHGFQQADRQALERVGTHSLETAVMVGVSPFVSFDMLLIGWRNFRMLNEIAGDYGIAPGAATQWRLLRQVMHNLAFVGLSELAVDSGSALLGSSLTSKLSARAGQGLGAGLMTARIGVQALQLCRPLPFDAQHKPKIGHIRERILARLKDQL